MFGCSQDCCGDTRSQCAREVHAQMKAGLQKVEFGAPSNTNGRSESSLTGATSTDRFVGSDGPVNESEEMAAEEDVLNMWADNSVANTGRE